MRLYKYYYFVVLIAVGLASCKSSESQPIELTSDPVTVSLEVINSTGANMRCHKTYGVDKPNVWVDIANGKSEVLTSNTHSPSGTIYTCYPDPSATIQQPNPATGNFQMSYGYWNGAPHVTCNNDCNKGYPTAAVHYTGNNWQYILKWANPQDVVNNSVEFTIAPL